MTTTVKNLIQHIVDNCTAIDREERFRAMLDEMYSFDSVGGPFAGMSPSRVLEEMDETAFRCGVNDYEDGEGWVEIDGSYYERQEAEEAQAEFVANLEDEAGTIAEEEGEDSEEHAEKLAEIAQAEAFSF